MARALSARAVGPDPTYVNLCRLLSRLDDRLLSPDNAPNLAHSSYERSKTSTVSSPSLHRNAALMFVLRYRLA